MSEDSGHEVQEATEADSGSVASLQRIERTLTEARSAIAAVEARIPDVDPRAIGDLLDGLTFVATKVDELARAQSPDALAGHVEAIVAPLLGLPEELAELRSRLSANTGARDDGLAATVVERIEDLAHRLHDDSIASAKNIQEWAEDFRGRSTELLAGVEAVRAAIERDADKGAVAQGLEAALAATEDLRVNIARLGASISEITERNAAGFGDVRERLGQTTEQIIASMDVLTGVVGSTRTDMPAILGDAVTQVADAVTQQMSELRGPFLAMAERLDAALARAESLDEERASLAHLLERANAAIADVGARTDELTNTVTPGFVELRERVGSFQGEMREAFTALRDDVSGTVTRAADSTTADLSSISAGVNASQESLASLAARLEGFASVGHALSALEARASEIDGHVRDLASLQTTSDEIRTMLEGSLGTATRANEMLTSALDGARQALGDQIAEIVGRSAEILGGRVDASSGVIIERVNEQLVGTQEQVAQTVASLRERLDLQAMENASALRAGLEGFASEMQANSSAVGSAAEFLRDAAAGAQGHLERIRDEIVAVLGEQRVAQTDALSQQLDRLSALLEMQRAAVDQALATSMQVQQEALAVTSEGVARTSSDVLQEVSAGLASLRADLDGTANRLAATAHDVQAAMDTTRTTVDGSLAESQAGLNAAISRIQELVAGELERNRVEAAASLDATSSDLTSQIAAARDHITTSVTELTSVANSLPQSLQPAADEMHRVAQALERAVGTTIASVRLTAEEGATRVTETLEAAGQRSDTELRGLTAAVEAAIERISAQEEAITGGLTRMTSLLPQVSGNVTAAVESVTAASDALERRAGDFVALAGNALAQFADELTTSLGVGRSEMEGWVANALTEIDGRVGAGFAAFDARVDGGITDLTSRVEVGLGDLIAQIDGRVADLMAYIGSAVEEVTVRIDQRSEAASVESSATLEALGLRLDAMASHYETRFEEMQAQLTEAVRHLGDDAGARMDELLAASTQRLDEALSAIPTTEEVTHVLHERAAGALRSVRRRLVRMDDLMATLAGAEASMQALAGRIANLDTEVRALPSALDVAEVLLSSKRGLKRRVAAAPRTEPTPVEPVRVPTPVAIEQDDLGLEPMDEHEIDRDFPEVRAPAIAAPEAEALEDEINPDDPESILTLDAGEAEAAEGISDEDVEFLGEPVPPAAPKRKPVAKPAKRAAKAPAKKQAAKPAKKPPAKPAARKTAAKPKKAGK